MKKAQGEKVESIKKLPELEIKDLNNVVVTLSRPRLSKYLRVTSNNEQQALRLYVFNIKLSAAVMTDLHYIEVALRNKFDQELAAKFGHKWFKDADFLALVGRRSQDILLKVQKDAAKHWPRGEVLPPGKVIAELTFGFWLQLIDSKLEHKLWVPYLYKAFLPRKAPKRATFNQQLEKLRQLRNRIAHHEPIFHLDLFDMHRRTFEVAHILCPATALFMDQTSTVRRQVKSLNEYCQRHGFREKNK